MPLGLGRVQAEREGVEKEGWAAFLKRKLPSPHDDLAEMEKDGGEGSSPSRDLSPDSQFRATGVVSHWLQATGVRAAAMPFAHLGESEERRRPPSPATEQAAAGAILAAVKRKRALPSVRHVRRPPSRLSATPQGQ